MKVKICGITNPEDALLCESCGADYLGFIFYKGSKRYVSFDEAKDIINKLSPGTVKVGVFVNEEPEMINKSAEFLHLDYVQLHGNENPEVADKINSKVIKAFRINDSFDFDGIKYFSNTVPLFDTHSQDKFGGTGEKFNWDVIPESLLDKIILAGGISSANIEYIYRHIKPMAVDVSSSLELTPGMKDETKVKEFFNKIEQLRSSKW
ncbi:MAG: phosphoribosylanthranilate isomerase [Ignavibacteriales bacterium]|nr:MAG: phosphoribosylanthranilate isomerase [Ignavibacteriales bacterium]